MKITDDLEEIFIVVDKNDKIVDFRKRSECHSDKSLIHRSASVIIYNSQGQILLQKRSRTKDLYPGLYAVSASGHLSKGENYRKAAKREMHEEIGVDVPIKKVAKFILDIKTETEYKTLYVANYDGPFKINKKEVEFVKFFSKEDIRNMIDQLTPAAKRCFKELEVI